MRYFIAIDLSEDIKDYLYNLQKEIGNSLAKIRWIEKNNLHLTLKFLGDIDEIKISNVKKILSNVKFEPFEVKIEKIGVFPSENYVRVIWVGLNTTNKVIELQKDIDSALLNLFPKEQRFESHLTIGRVKLIKDKVKFIEKLKKIKIKDLYFNINKFRIYKSTLTRNGPIYEVIEEYS